MNRMLEGRWLRVAGAAVLAFAVLLLAAPAPSSAASYTLAYSGTILSTNGPGDPFAVLGYIAGDAISGTLTFDPFNEGPGADFLGQTSFDQASAAMTFNLSHSGGPSTSYSQSGSGFVGSAENGFFSALGFGYSGADYELVLNLITSDAGTSLLSLAGLPATPTELIAMLGGTAPSASGHFNIDGYGGVEFDIAFTAVTPIPAALPLFATALGGLGFMTWRRRKAAGTLPA